jgi:hypothetical protein
MRSREKEEYCTYVAVFWSEKETKTATPSRLMLFVVDSTFVNPLSTRVLTKYDFEKFF